MKNFYLPLCLVALTGAAGQGHAQDATLPQVLVTADKEGALTVPDTAQARTNIQRTPGAVALIADTVFKDTPVQTVKDMLDWTPGVFAQPRFGDDARVSIRGSGLSRNFGNRGLQMYMDGVPIHTSDGLVDLFEIDPSAYRYVEVYKGANALRYGGNSLGGAINYVTPTGRDAARFESRIDAGSFGYLKAQASTAGANGAYDYFVTASAQHVDGFRDHSNGHEQRGSANLGYRLSADAETRFYINLNKIRQRLPGEVTKDSALNTPRAADPYFELVDQQRNIDSVRLANKTTIHFNDTTMELGLFGVRRHVMHPIYQWLDYRVHDFGGFARVTDEQNIGSYRNRLVVGVNLHNGSIDNDQYRNLPGAVKGALAASTLDKSRNVSAYAEDSFYVRPDLALIGGVQFLHAKRERRDRFLSNGDQSGRNSFDLYSPKLGALWDIDPAWQLFANLSRSVEVPTFDVNSFATPASSTADAQTATTIEIGTRSRRQDRSWEISLYRARIKNELQCLANAATPGACSVANADRTVHQGVEAGIGAAMLKSALTNGDSVWFNAAYTFNDFRFDNDSRYRNNRLPGAPRHYLRAELLYRHPSGLYAGPNTEWVPQAYYADSANTQTVDRYTLWNFRIGYDPQKAGWSGYIEARNLLDARYIASTAVAQTADATSALSEPGSGRAIYGGVRLTW